MNRTHYSGESQFVDDIIRTENEVIVGIVGAPCAAGRVTKIDVSEALKVSGVLGVFTAQDFHEKYWGAIIKDQPFLVIDEIGYKHEPVCAVAATSFEALAEAKRRVKIEVISREPIIDGREAYLKKQILVKEKSFQRGAVQEALNAATYRHSGVLEIGGQEHFYLEPQSSLVVPVDRSYLKVYCATQHTTETQQECALATGLGFHQVGCEARRLGGGFGGKETQASHFAAIAAVVAHRLQRPARLVLNRDDDFWMTGKRHPFRIEYDVGYEASGRIKALKMNLIGDGGAYTDLSPSILDRALYHADGAYHIENLEFVGCMVKTSTASNTALRGFGGPQGNLAIENIMEEIAQHLSIKPEQVRRENLYGIKDRNVTPYGQVFENNVLHSLLDRALVNSRYHALRRQINQFNEKHKDRVRGLALSFTKFGISFTSKFLNQASSLIHLQTDGTVQVSTGAVEMGQGVQIKIAHVVSREFGISLEKIQVMPTSTERTANTSPTAASSGADMNGMATLRACHQLKKRLCAFLNSFRTTNEWREMDEGSFGESLLNDWIFEKGQIRHCSGDVVVSIETLLQKARLCRVSLTSQAYYKTPELEKNPFYYYTQGAGVTAVEVDLCTGQVRIMAADIVMDLGTTIDEKIDRGQIAGAYIQGVGWMTMEELYTDNTGELKTHSPSTYKIPLMTDIPERFNIDILPNPEFIKNIYRSKAVGEPPLLLGASAWLAVKDALHYKTPRPHLKVPATPENVLGALLKWEKTSDD